MKANLLFPFISPTQLQQQLSEDFLIFETGTNTVDRYRAGHIPHARYLDTNFLERPPAWNHLPDMALAKALARAGITHTQKIVLYARDTTAAARVALILHYAGVQDVRVLDGGLSTWIAAGYPLETEENPPEPVLTFGIRVPARAEVFVDIHQVKQRLGDENSVVVSVRSWAEHIGETSGYDFIPAKGRIPGSVWGGGGRDKDGMEDFHTPDGTLRLREEIAARWRKAGITPDKNITFYCGTGWRASEAFWIAKAMDFPKISVYDGGWLEWSSDPQNPIETSSGNQANQQTNQQTSSPFTST